MSDESAASRLTALEFLERVQVRDLARTRRWIVDAQRRVGEEQIRRERAAQPPPEWTFQAPTGKGSGTLHTTLGEHAEECWASPNARTKAVGRQQAVQALTDGASPCAQCRPDKVLGFL
ncbi:DUF6233 domain-containing protein [Streptomyces sp. NPDC050738]|uniref:DUF6233 domain-containing protein n=1 Tax=Streptomyces sp. NPDC050738 TaxID=3154744 RepID=UPI003412925E